MLNTGDRVRHRFNDELGPGVIVGVEGRRVSVLFPESGKTLQIASNSDALEKLELTIGGKAKLASTGEHVVVAEIEGHSVRLDDGREMPALDVWPLSEEPTPIDRLAKGEIDGFEDVRNRLDGLRLLRLRRADGLGSFLGGRIHLFPHQLYVADRATRALERGEPVRWLLADEVGLGKTVEAGLIMNRLLHTGRIQRALVIAPDTLVVQWLGEMWRKYHQLFVLLDRDRLRDVRREHGPNFNPFDAHRRAIISLERLSSDPKLRKFAAESEIDLLVVDEAHRLRRPLTQRGNAAYRAVERISKLGRHLLFLTATPLEDDAHGFFRLLQLLRPDEFPQRDGRAGKDFQDAVEKRLAGEVELPPCTSSTRRSDIGGLPPREPHPVMIDDKHGWATLRGVTRALRRRRAKKGPKREQLQDLIWRSLASPQALAAAMGRRDRLRGGVGAAMNADPRVGWLEEQAPRWAREREKTLIFVAHRETLDHLREVLSRRVKVAIFHEDLPTERRDLEVARFRLPEGPAILISTESGGEGRNFEFCKRLVLHDLPWNPGVLEQRIGRLDRIGRDRPTEIVYFRWPEGLGRAVVEVMEAVRLFEEPMGGVLRELRPVAERIGEIALFGPEHPKVRHFKKVLRGARVARDRVRRAAYHELHRDPYDADMAEEILDRVPSELDALTEAVVTRAASRFGFGCEPQSGDRTWLFEYGTDAMVEHLPGLKPGKRWRGTFDRQLAVEEESLDFFASGHPLIEGILAELEDGDRGRAGFVLLPMGKDAEEGMAMLAVYPSEDKSDDIGFEMIVVDAEGRRRPDLLDHLLDPTVQLKALESGRPGDKQSWTRMVRGLAKGLPQDRTPQAVLAFRVVR